MALTFYDSDQVAVSGPHRSFFDGNLGGASDHLIYIRNDDAATYYTNIQVTPLLDGAIDPVAFINSGYGIKFLSGQRRPTEGEWDLVHSGMPIAIPDIGTTLLADTVSYHPFWIRLTVPGGSPAELRENISTRIYAYERQVGS